MIELSIVILIIGVLIAGVTQASRVVRQSKLTTAKTLTQSAPVNSIRGLILWLEPTLEASLVDSEEVDLASVTKWYNVNPQDQITRRFDTTTASTSTVTYRANGTNSLPALLFSGTSGANMKGTNSDFLKTPDNTYTFFVVAKSTNLTVANTAFYNGVTGSTGFGVSKTASGYQSITGNFSAITSESLLTLANTAEIISGTISPSTVLGAAATQYASTWKNGAATSIASAALSTAMAIPTSNFFIGDNNGSTTAGTPFIGEISEIIIFDTVLRDSDRKEIEKYLSKKYAIAVSS